MLKNCFSVTLCETAGLQFCDLCCENSVQSVKRKPAQR